MNGTYWTRHRELDNTLSSLFMFLPEKFRMPENIRDASATHLNLNLHASIICLHHAAIEKAEKHGLPDHIKQNSIARLRAAAEEVVNIIRINTHATLFFVCLQLITPNHVKSTDIFFREAHCALYHFTAQRRSTFTWPSRTHKAV